MIAQFKKFVILNQSAVQDSVLSESTLEDLDPEVLQSGALLEGRGLVRRFPREFGFVAAEVTVAGGLPVNRTAQIQRLDDAARRQLEVVANEF